MGTKLGDSSLSLGQDASEQFRVVARACAGCAPHFSLISHRSRARILSYLRFSVAAAEDKQFLPLDRNEMLERTSGRAPHFVPCDDDTPENCEANKRDGEEYLRVVLEEAAATRVIGEDLGTVPDYVRPNLRSLGVAGFKIPQ